MVDPPPPPPPPEPPPPPPPPLELPPPEELPVTATDMDALFSPLGFVQIMVYVDVYDG